MGYNGHCDYCEEDNVLIVAEFECGSMCRRCYGENAYEYNGVYEKDFF